MLNFPGTEIRRAAGMTALLALSFSPLVSAGSEPLYIKNLSPVAGLLGLPSQRSAVLADSLQVNLHGSIASHYIDDADAATAITLDGETQRLALELRYPLAERWEVSLELPWMRHDGGELDSLIDNWHDLWGMSDGGRAQAPRDRLLYSFGEGGQPVLLLDDTVSGLGDTTMGISYRLPSGERSAASLNLGYKWATGDEDKLLGSGGNDLYLVARYSSSTEDGRWSWHGQAGYLRAGSSDIGGLELERNQWFGGLAIDWAVADAVSLLAQLDSHSAPVSSDLTSLGDTALYLSMGLRWRIDQRWAIDFNFVEDVKVETAPDITFQVSLRYRQQ